MKDKIFEENFLRKNVHDLRYCNSLIEAFCSIDAERGLPEEVFLAVSSVVPIANVDLLIFDENKRVLLAWRDDKYFGKGWHLPGGCIRFKETMLERVHKTALNELGVDVEVNDTPVAVRDVIVEKGNKAHRVRAHHLAVLFCCNIVAGAVCVKSNEAVYNSGDLKWFKYIPRNILTVHNAYNDIFRAYGLIDKEGLFEDA